MAKLDKSKLTKEQSEIPEIERLFFTAEPGMWLFLIVAQNVFFLVNIFEK